MTRQRHVYLPLSLEAVSRPPLELNLCVGSRCQILEILIPLLAGSIWLATSTRLPTSPEGFDKTRDLEPN